MATPNIYNEKYHDRWAWSLALKGATDADIAEAFGISVRTLHRWKKEHESFAEALGPGKDVADAQVKHSLYQRAVGYDAKDIEQIIVTDPGHRQAAGGEDPCDYKAYRPRHYGVYVLAQQPEQGRVHPASGNHPGGCREDLPDGEADGGGAPSPCPHG